MDPFPSVPRSSKWLAPGDLGTLQTLLAMRQQAHAGAANPIVAACARSIITATTPAVAANELRAWLGAHTVFVPDPDDEELVRTPLYQVQAVQAGGVSPGDCDDVATLGAALALAAGLRCAFVVLGFEGPGSPFQHVYTLVHTVPPVNFDVTRSPNTMPATRAAYVEV